MQNVATPDLRYPIGVFQAPAEITEARRQEWTGTLAQAPAKYRAAVEKLSAEQLDAPYRPGGWTVRQVVTMSPTAT